MWDAEYLFVWSYFLKFLQLFAVGFFMEGFFLLYDKVFNHEIIKDVLWSALTFDGLSFNHIRESLSAFMISSSLVILLVSCIGFFTLRTNSKCLHVFVSNNRFPKIYLQEKRFITCNIFFQNSEENDVIFFYLKRFHHTI